MSESFEAFRRTIGFGFKAAPLQATGQLLTGVVMAAGPPILVWAGKVFVDAVSAQDLETGLWAVALLAVGVGVLMLNVFIYCNCVFAVLERTRALADRKLMETFGGADSLAHHEHPEYLDQVHRIREERDGLGQMTNATAGIVRSLSTLVAVSVLLAQVHPALLALAALGGVSVFVGRKTRDLQVAAQEETSEAERLRRDLFELGTNGSSGKELRVFGLTDELVRLHHKASDPVVAVRHRADWKGAVLQSLDALLSAAGYVGAVVFVISLALNGRATPGDVVLAVGLAANLGWAARTMVSYGTNFLRTLRVARRFLWLERYAVRVARTPENPLSVPASVQDGIELRDVTFAYPETDRLILDRLSLQLPAGSVVALVGENGAGKTTLVKLLSGFYVPDSGSVLVDGTPIERFPLAEWQSRVSATFQDHAAFEFVARETVGVGDLRRLSDEGAVRTALDRAGATSVIDVLPDGLESQLGTQWDGVDLSGGQWQKLALGRGLMRQDPLLVVFDEPTAALDPQTEHALFTRFAEAARDSRSRGTVTLLVSHRFSTVRMADLIVVLDSGSVLELGSHAELMAHGGLYAELYGLQSRAYQ
ncbi:ABC transporter ATP-binding protein [Tenggerimyces flavus]|uniref:ABC transporter ATP-binding protein n=1 Tax=Tenggerimyces flavus TaxID=1708749 RepID=A0ABV7YH79_9ACTN|nr:ABC transporter ATP-binding protein [Tenggerimyces flavus]MBM7786070.1 ABC-type multidrug transport system fused ATPase/permease subunit [Tenggerimyces flavus]